MATVKGLWKFNDTISMTGWAASADATKEYVNFTAYQNDDNIAYSYIGFNLQHYTYSSGIGTHDNLQFLKTKTTADPVYVWQKPSTSAYILGWSKEKVKFVYFGATEQTVSDYFYTWLTANANPSQDWQKCGWLSLIAGVWKFNEVISIGSGVILDAPFVYTKTNGEKATSRSASFLSNRLYYYPNGTRSSIIYSESNGWADECYRTIDFGETPVKLSSSMRLWLINNAIADGCDCIRWNFPTDIQLVVFAYSDDIGSDQTQIASSNYGNICAFLDKFYVCRARSASNTHEVYNITVNGKAVVYSSDQYVALENLHYHSGDITIEVLDTVYSTDNTGRYGFAFRESGEDSGGEDATGRVTISYNGKEIATFPTGKIATLECAGKKMKGDIVIAYAVEEDDSSTTLIEFWIIPPGQSFPGSDDWYQAESGMTWLDWCNSEYNTRGYFCHDAGASSVWDSKGEYRICTSSQTAVDAKESIISGHSYVLISTSTDLGGSN
jgi:hypothetical protein